MQRRKGSGNADWHFLTCISNNRLGTGHCTGMYIRESDIMDAILREVRIFVQVNNTAASTYKSEVTSLSVKAKQLDGEINKLMEISKSRYEDFVMGVADKDDLRQCRNERAIFQTKLHDVNNQINLLNQKNQQYQLFCDALNDKTRIGQLVSDYLQSVTIFAGGHTDVQWMD